MSYLAHSDNASSPHQSPGKPCCTHSACHGRTRVRVEAPMPHSHKHSKIRLQGSACWGCGQPEKTLGHPPAASLHLTGLTLWSGSKHSPGALQGLAVLKAGVLHMPGSALLIQSTRPPLDVSAVEKIPPLLTYPPVHPVSSCTGSSSGTGIALATDIPCIIYYNIYTD